MVAASDKLRSVINILYHHSAAINGLWDYSKELYATALIKSVTDWLF